MKGTFDEEDAAWWESWRKRLRTERGYVRSTRRVEGKSQKRKRVVKDVTKLPPVGVDVPLDVDDIEVDESTMQEDMRILIRVGYRFCFVFCFWHESSLNDPGLA
jgi:SWI/SNF-related matrix-associated actin-dependent regulator of chromatin subfamily B protein 1